jgi:hypothetical protein
MFSKFHSKKANPLTVLRIRINSIGVISITKGIIFRIFLRVFIFLDKHFFWGPNEKNYNGINLNKTLFKNINLYLNFADLHDKMKVIKCGEEVLINRIHLWGTEYSLTPKDWLTDPLTRLKWDGKVHFHEANIEEVNMGDVKLIMEFNKMYHIINLAEAYHVTEEIKYIRKIEDYLGEWVKAIPSNASVVNKIMLDKSLRCINLIHVIILCSTSTYFRENVLNQVIIILINEEKQIRRFSTPKWFKTNTGTNHTIGEMIGLITTQLIIEKISNINYKQQLKKEFYYLNHSLDNIITSKGVYLEQSANYSRLVAELLVFLDIVLKLLDVNSTRFNYSNKYLKSILSYIEILSYHKTIPNFGDNDSSTALYTFNKILSGSEHLIKYKNLVDQDNLSKKDSNSLVCKQSGQIIWKSNDSNNVYIQTRVGNHSFLPLGSSSHSHNDILSLIISVMGKELFIDRGSYLYNSGISIRNNDRATESHNTISFEGMEQATFHGKWAYITEPKSKIDNVNIEEDRFSLSGSCSYCGVKHNRHIIYKSSRITIDDIVEIKNGSQTLSINFLLSPKFRAIIENNMIRISNTNKIFINMSFDKKMKLEIQDIYYHPGYAIKTITQKIIAKKLIQKSIKIRTIIQIYE